MNINTLTRTEYAVRRRSKSKHAALWTLIDALDLYETWFVAEEKLDGTPGKFTTLFNKRGEEKITLLHVAGGYLFVRTA